MYERQRIRDDNVTDAFFRNLEQAVARYSPLTAAETMHVACRFAETVGASIFGTVVVGLVQGSLGGLMFWVTRPAAPGFLGPGYGRACDLSVMGVFVVRVSAAVILAPQNEWASAALVSVWGGLIIATIDNLLYPILVGNQLRLHTLATFIGMVGGVILFGAAGIVLGPAVIAITQEVIEILKQRPKLGLDLRLQNGVEMDAS